MKATLLPPKTAQAGPVVSLRALGAARRAATFLRGCLHDPAWLRGVGIEVVGDEVRVLVVLAWETPLIRRCLPRSVDLVPVRITVEEAE